MKKSILLSIGLFQRHVVMENVHNLLNGQVYNYVTGVLHCLFFFYLSIKQEHNHRKNPRVLIVSDKAIASKVFVNRAL